VAHGFTAGFVVDRLLQALAALGVDVARMCRNLGIDRQGIRQIGAVVPRTTVLGLLRAALEETRDEHLGLHLAEHMPLVGPVSYLFRSSETVGEGLEALARVCSVASSRTRASLDSKSVPARFTIETDSGSDVAVGRQLLDYLATVVVILLREVTARDRPVTAVHLQHSEKPGNVAEYRRVLGCEVRFSQPHCAIFVSPATLQLRSRLASPSVESALRRTIDALHETRAGAALSARVPATVYLRLWMGEAASEGAIAKALGLSVRSLQRGLRTEGASLRSLRRETQLAVAQEILASSQMSIKEIAARVGFSSTASFDHAFKALRGVSPQRFRAFGAQRSRFAAH
jgi:AraC-like DNA-binding protein